MSTISILPPYLVGDPEAVAMLQAFYSRSNLPIQTRLDELGDNLPKIKESLNKFYLGYGHDSIGDCGNTAVFIEGVSMLCAKALEDNPLFNGQETSTRFISFSNSQLHKPWLGSTELSKIAIEVQDSWMAFYIDYISFVTDKLKDSLPYKNYQDTISEDTWAASIKARAFDIMRAFLPAGTLTQLSFYGSLRTLRDSMSSLYYHPLSEVYKVARSSIQHLAFKYPSAFSKDKYTEEQSAYMEYFPVETFYNYTTLYLLANKYTRVVHGSNMLLNDDGRTLDEGIDWANHRITVLKWEKIRQAETPLIHGTTDYPDYLLKMLSERPKGVPVSYQLGRHGSYTVQCFLDFGSYRDLQRHRNCKNPIPILTTDYGIHPWYLNQLKAIDESLYNLAVSLEKENTKLLNSIQLTHVNHLLELQYVIPMGYRVPVELTLSLDQMVYISELRSSKSVHPTLRPIAKQMGRFLQKHGIEKVYVDESEDAFVPWRGKQTIHTK